jgi:TRAP-type uncharacterized transport system substrate-binding protein
MPENDSDSWYAVAWRWTCRGWNYLVSHRAGVILVLVFLSLLVSAWQIYKTATHRQVIVYTGTSTASASEHGERIRKHFRTVSNGRLVTYDIELRPTDGLRENRTKVADAAPGELVLGFDQDGFEPPEQVRTLMPLNDVTLHVVVRSDEKSAVRGPLGIEIESPGVKTFQGVLDYYRTKHGREPLCFLGPRGSGGRQIAEQVLRRYGVDLRYADFGDHIAWNTAYRLLRNGEIDVIFEANEVGSSAMTERAREKFFKLISLDNVEGLVTGQNNLQRIDIPGGTYSAGTNFNAAPVTTVCTKRLIICPTSMSSFDAYYLTAGLREAMRQVTPNPNLSKQPQIMPAPGLIVPLHPGAEDFDHGRAPLVWLERLVSQHWQWAVTVLFGFAAFMLRRPRTPAPASPAPVLALPEGTTTALATVQPTPMLERPIAPLRVRELVEDSRDLSERSRHFETAQDVRRFRQELGKVKRRLGDLPDDDGERYADEVGTIYRHLLVAEWSVDRAKVGDREALAEARDSDPKQSE